MTRDDIVKPGHVFPLHAKAGGVLERQGHTEGSIDLVRLAGFSPAAVLCEIMNEDGSMAKGDKLLEFAKQHDLFVLSIDDLINYRHYHEDLIADKVDCQLPMENYGTFELLVIKEKYSDKQHIVLSALKDSHQPTLVRIHSSCITGDIFCSKRCDCKKQLDYSLQRISEEGGVVIYLDQEGRGLGLFDKIKAYALQEKGMDTVEANQMLGLPIDARDYYIAANILKNLGIDAVRLLTNNPAKVSDLIKYGIADVQIETMPVFKNENNEQYLLTKTVKLNHLMNLTLQGVNYV